MSLVGSRLAGESEVVCTMEYILGWRDPPAEKWTLCRRAYTVKISPFPDAYVAGLPFVGTQPGYVSTVYQIKSKYIVHLHRWEVY
jgi:hypothetical protein